MSRRPKSTRYYPAVFTDYVVTLCDFPSTVIEVPFETQKQAVDFRMTFSAFQSAAMREGLDAVYKELAAIIVQLKGNTAIVRHKDFSPEALKMKEALEQTLKSQIRPTPETSSNGKEK